MGEPVGIEPTAQPKLSRFTVWCGQPIAHVVSKMADPTTEALGVSTSSVMTDDRLVQKWWGGGESNPEWNLRKVQ